MKDITIFSLNANDLNLFDEQRDAPNMINIFLEKYTIPAVQLSDTDDNPQIPIGQMFWAFISDPKVAAPARTYITANAFQTLKMSPFFTYCPHHPSILLKRPPPHTSIKCVSSGCGYYLCGDCNKWHQNGSCPEKTRVPLGDRVCPYCHVIVEKSQACNHIACRCGKHFCYYCGAGPWDSDSPCYDHLRCEHGGHSNDPPDYRKFIKNETNVTEQELNEFYLKYPQLKHLEI